MSMRGSFGPLLRLSIAATTQRVLARIVMQDRALSPPAGARGRGPIRSMIPGFFGGEARLTWYRIIGRRAGDNWLSPGAVVALEPLQPQLRGALAESSRENCSHLQVRTIATCTTGAHMVTTERVKGGPKLDQSGGGKLDHPAARWRV